MSEDFGERFDHDEEPATVEDLWAALDGATGEHRVHVMLELGRRLGAAGEVDQALSLADTALAEAGTLEDPRLRAHAGILRGQALAGQSAFAESATAHLAAAAAARESLDARLAGDALMMAGDSLSSTPALTQALEAFTSAEGEFLSVDDAAGAGRAAFHAGRVLWQMDANAEALEVLSRARGHWRTVGVPGAVVEVDDLAAAALMDMGDFQQAVALLRAAMYVTESLPDGDVPYARLRLGTALAAAGRPGDGLVLLEDAAAAYSARGDLGAVGRSLWQQAQCRWDLGEPEAAFDLLARARAHLDACGRDRDVESVDVRRAVWLHNTGHLLQAAAVNAALTGSAVPSTAFMAQVRLVDNLRVAGQFTDCLHALDELEHDLAENPVDLATTPGPGGPVWRAAVRALMTYQVGQTDLARQHALRALALCGDGDSPAERAWVHDVLTCTGRTVAPGADPGDEADAASAGSEADRALAIALYLAAGDAQRAGQMSEHYLLAGAQGGAQSV